MLFTENFSDITWGKHTNENFGIGKSETADIVGKKPQTTQQICRSM